MIDKEYIDLYKETVKMSIIPRICTPDFAVCLYLQFFSGKLKRKPTNKDAEEKENEKRQDQLRCVCLFEWSDTDLLEQKQVFTTEKSWTPTGLVCYTNMAAVTSCEN